MSRPGRGSPGSTVTDDRTLFTITGLPARLLKLLLGTPFLLGGGLGVSVGLARLPSATGVAALVFGGVVGLVGVLVTLSAVTNDEVAVKQSRGDLGP